MARRHVFDFDKEREEEVSYRSRRGQSFDDYERRATPTDDFVKLPKCTGEISNSRFADNTALSLPQEKTIASISKSVPYSVKREAEEKATAFLTKIKQNQDKIEAAKEKAEAAREMKTGWFGIGQKKINKFLLDDSVTNKEIQEEQSKLIQECVSFTCSSIDFACAMSQTISRMMVEGFVDRDGKLIHLASSEKEMAKKILTQANDWVQKQLQIEQVQAEQNYKINAISKRAEGHDKDIADIYEKLDKISEKKQQQLSDNNNFQQNQLAYNSTNGNQTVASHDTYLEDAQTYFSDKKESSSQKKSVLVPVLIALLSVAGVVIVVGVLYMTGILKFAK